MIKDITKVKVNKIIRMCQALEDSGCEEASFEFVIGSLFSEVYENVREELRQQYTQGFLDGQKEKNSH